MKSIHLAVLMPELVGHGTYAAENHATTQAQHGNHPGSAFSSHAPHSACRKLISALITEAILVTRMGMGRQNTEEP